jgi:hypothetical protein
LPNCNAPACRHVTATSASCISSGEAIRPSHA